jgi:hypothetical protein
VLSADIDFYTIERWDKDEIVTKPRKLRCVQYILRFNRTQESVTAIRSTIAQHDICKGVENKELYLELKDGIDVSTNLLIAHQKQRKELYQVTGQALKLFRGK